MIKSEELKDFLDEQYERYNTPNFIADDPISIPHLFEQKEDIEISAFFSALIAWGRRDIIMRNARRLMELMDMQPYKFIVTASRDEVENLNQFVHRIFNGQDCMALVYALREVYESGKGLEGIFTEGLQADSVHIGPAIISARNALTAYREFPPRTHKHLANPAKGSSAKRICMFLRWMVRKDNTGVDFGIWEGIGMHQLLCPLDVHTGTIARKLGILSRKQNDWKTTLELTDKLRTFDPNDPVKYDFALFGLGAYNDL